MNGLRAFVGLTFRLIAERLVRLPMHSKLRPRLLRLLGARIGAGTRIDEIMLVNVVAGFGNLTVDDEAYVGAGSLIDLTGQVYIGAHAAISPGCTIMTHADPGSMYGNDLVATYPRKVEPVMICEHAWIGARATILAGVTIGHHAVVGAGAVVLSDVLPEQVVYGVPAKAAYAPTR